MCEDVNVDVNVELTVVVSDDEDVTVNVLDMAVFFLMSKPEMPVLKMTILRSDSSM